ncbi:MAG: putative toxin-antitoxin system toxin component, PIN family, partial [Candidatus Hydrogenedentes bacterium CG07_land_8_20_14_0_80_42_17]
MKFRTVIDTNVAISSLLFDVRLNNLHLAWRNKLFVMIVSPKMVDEYIKVLAYSKFKLEQFEIYHLVYHEILPFITPVKTKNIRPVIKADPQDDIFLSAGLW